MLVPYAQGIPGNEQGKGVYRVKKSVAVAVTILSVVALVAMGVYGWLYAYHHQKNTDNLPQLTAMAQMDEEEANGFLTGYRKIQLEYVWGKPDESGADYDVWNIEDKTILTVRYDQKEKVVACCLSTNEE